MSGSKWYKCDFHLHTSKSKCFIEDSDLVSWVDKVVEQKIECVALTNHNSGGDIDALKPLLKEKGIFFFPGVEITCSDSKVHLLVIFDVGCSQDDVETFLIRAGIDKENFGEEDAYSNKNIIDIADLANEFNAIIIAAHIDEFSSLKNVRVHASVADFLSKDNVMGVQITKDLKLLMASEDQYVKKIIELTIKKKKSILTFSDNPSDQNQTKHGVSGIGSCFSFIKLSQSPNISSLKQALKMPDIRVVNFFEQENFPQKPTLFLKSLEVKNANKLQDTFIDFNSGFNAIIGGRGTGKSTIIRLLRCLLNKNDEIAKFQDIKKDHEEFFDDKNSVIGEEASVELRFSAGSIEYRIAVNSIKKINSYVGRYYRITNNFEEEVDKQNFFDVLSSLEIELFSQKQLYALADQPGQLNYYIDRKIINYSKLIKDISDIRMELKKSIHSYKEILAESRNLNIADEKMKSTGAQLEEIKKLAGFDLEEFLTKQTESKKISKEFAVMLNDYFHIEKTAASLIESVESIEGLEILKGDEHLIQFEDTKNKFKDEILNVKKNFSAASKSIFKEIIMDTRIDQRKNLNVKFLDIKSKTTNLSDLLTQKNVLEQQLRSKSTLPERMEKAEENVLGHFNELKVSCEELRKRRMEVLEKNIPKTSNLLITPLAHRDIDHFEISLRNKLSIGQDTFTADFDKIKSFLNEGGDVGENLIKFVKGLRNNNELELNQKLVKKIIESIEDDLYELLTLLPEDTLRIKYKNNNTGEFLDLSKGSHGQKTSAVLGIILHLNSSLVIIDQPEDDLDNKLIYGLIVDNIIKNKNFKQMIMVTHNANIPVNGDADLIISMESNSKRMKVHSAGELDSDEVRSIVCDIMEGGAEAFTKRASKYGIR